MASRYYNGNINLKNGGTPIAFSEEQLNEYILCKTDPIYFIRTYCKIISLDKGLIPFDLYDYQIRFISTIHKERKVISIQSRQQGKTQCVAGYILWYVNFNDTKTAAILANKGAAAREIMSRFQSMFEHLPDFLQQGVRVWNKGDIELENGSKIFTGATSSSGIRGKSVNFLYVDEVAVIPNTVADAFFTSTYPTISSGETTKIVLTSTPIGYNHFWKFWNGAETGANGFVPVRVHYYEHPNRGEKWAAEQKALLGDLRYAQEVLCAFQGSSSTLIDSDAIARMSSIFSVYSKDGLDLYTLPVKAKEGVKSHSYVIVVDTSKGTGGDYSAFSIIDITKTPYTLVGKYRDNKIAPMLYPSVIHKVATDYNDAFVLFELNSSEQVPHILYYDMEYGNILMVSRSKRGQEISGGFGGSSSQLGVITDKKTKRIGCSTLKSLIEEGKLHIFDADTISELSTFIQVKDSFAADQGYTDDLVMTLVLFGWLTTQPYFKELTDVDLRKEMYQGRMDAIDAEMLPIGIFSNGIETEAEIFNF